MKAIAILNLKGGVGKTITAVNMAYILTHDYNRRVLLVDCDSQCNATEFMGVDGEKEINLYDIMTGNSDPMWYDNTTPTRWGVEMLPACANLMSLDISQLGQSVKSRCLADFCDALRTDREVDYVIFDCPPAFNAASAAALLAADEVIVPIKLDAFSIRGLSNIRIQVNNMIKLNPNLKLSGALITMWRNADVVQQAEAALRKCEWLPTFKSVIRRTDKVDESTFEKSPIEVYSPRSAAGCDYRMFVAEYVGGCK